MQGFIFYSGPSMLDGKPVVAVATGLETPSPNTKTGPMVQVYFLRSDISPLVAIQTGEDISICGSCIHRGTIETNPAGIRKNVGRSCYVTIMHGPRVVWTAYQQGLYPTVPISAARRLLAGRSVRLGAYGDPGCVPFAIIEQVIGKAGDITGYTHAWKLFPELSAFCMASTESEEERSQAHALGFRTFRTRSKDDPLLAGEGHCPASAEMGKATQCIRCVLCSGHRGPGKSDIAIVAHGARARHFKPSLPREPLVEAT